MDDVNPRTAETQLMSARHPTGLQVKKVIEGVRQQRELPYMLLTLVRHGEPLEGRFFALLIEDRTVGMRMTCGEFFQQKRLAEY